MTTNREWLYGLDVADLAAWFDAEHAEPNGDLSPENGVSDPDGGSNVACMAQDIREKLEAEASELTADYAASGDACDPLYHGILELLDRQAAITEREHPGLTVSDDESLINWRGRNYLLQSRVLNAERERDEFSLKLKHEMELNRDNRNAHDLERIAELTAERDEWKARAEQLANDALPDENGVSGEDGGSSVAYVAQDSREKLEADVEEICWGKNDNRYFAQKCYLSSYSIEVDEGNVMANHEGHVLMTVIMHLLDRQAAITERECESAAWKANYRHAMARADKLQGQVNELTAERDALRIYRDSWVSKATVLEGDVDRLVRERDELQAKVDELEVEANGLVGQIGDVEGSLLIAQSKNRELREKLSQAIGHASDIIALQDLTAVDMKGETKP